MPRIIACPTEIVGDNNFALAVWTKIWVLTDDRQTSPTERHAYVRVSSRQLSPDRREDPYFNKLQRSLRKFEDAGLITVRYSRGRYEITVLNYFQILREIGAASKSPRAVEGDSKPRRTDPSIKDPNRSDLSVAEDVMTRGACAVHQSLLTEDREIGLALSHVPIFVQRRWVKEFEPFGLEQLQSAIYDATAMWLADPKPKIEIGPFVIGWVAKAKVFLHRTVAKAGGNDRGASPTATHEAKLFENDVERARLERAKQERERQAGAFDPTPERVSNVRRLTSDFLGDLDEDVDDELPN